MPRHIRDLLTVQSAKFEKLPSDKGTKLQRKWCTFYSITKKLSTLAVRFTLAFSGEVLRNYLRPFLFPWDLDNYYRIRKIQKKFRKIKKNQKNSVFSLISVLEKHLIDIQDGFDSLTKVHPGKVSLISRQNICEVWI